MADNSVDGPYVQIATICGTSLVEKQGSLSVIRIQDRIQLAGPGDQMQPQPLNAFQLVIVLKSGGMRGKFNLQIIPNTPSGKQLPPLQVPSLFEGEERGVVVITPLGIVAEEEGLYWFDVTLEGTLLTRIPLRVMYQKLQLPFGLQIQPPPAG